MDTVIYQQDGAPPRCSNASLEYLHRYLLGDRLISRRTDHPWPACSPKLTLLDNFSWRNLKDTTINALKNNHRTEIRRVSHEMLDRVVTNFNLGVATAIQR